MKDLADIETKYEQLPVAKQHQFFAACIRHTAGAFARVEPLPSDFSDQCVQPTLSALESGQARDPDVATSLVGICESFSDRFGESEDSALQSIAFACATALEIAAELDNEEMQVVVNNLDETITICVPDDDDNACDEEFDLRVRFLDALAADDVQTLQSLVSSILNWERQWETNQAS